MVTLVACASEPEAAPRSTPAPRPPTWERLREYVDRDLAHLPVEEKNELAELVQGLAGEEWRASVREKGLESTGGFSSSSC